MESLNKGKLIYGAGANVVAANGTAPFFVLQGSETKVVKLRKLAISGVSLTAVAYVRIALQKYLTPITGGTSSDPAKIAFEGIPSTLSVLKIYTVAPSAPTVEGSLGEKRVLGQATTAVAAGYTVEATWDFTGDADKDRGQPTLYSATQGFALAFPVAPGSATTVSIEVEWSEE